MSARLDLVVATVDDSVPGTRSLTLVAPGGGRLPSYTPGSHLVIDVPAGEGRARRGANAYSLTGESIDPQHYAVSVLRCAPAAEGGTAAGGSAWVHGLAVGDRVTATPPRSAFAPVHRATRHLLVSAGIGITPLLSHLRSHVRWGRDVELVHVCRDGRGAHVDELAQLAGDRVTVLHDRADLAADLAVRLADQPLGTHLYTCGPPGFMDAVVATATDLGWPASRVHLEPFGVEALDPGEPFTVGLGGEVVEVPSGTSLLEALEDAGRVVPNLCRQGVCGECRVPVAAGSSPVLHRDLFLSDDERARGDVVMACVSRALPAADGRAHLEVAL
ncbi:PDR/VanB family oxidoreductase [Nocardioides zeae]|uniref:PDR/VanB family oxidoreductase n=1 Tax=Nocardioides imazamoxiresistens TaxID=3231893 RepID=A0ABU3PXN8_9ACTN|nr:PDR/VanB family oxidoreductase [Nocardioides zeae]MDT9594005.1 PDR/VanB family oxidoreductase [Nocardioides zeae]